MNAVLKTIAKGRAFACARKGDKEGVVKWLRHVEDQEIAGDVLARLGDYAGATARYERAGASEKAAEAAVRSGDAARAGKLLASIGQKERAADILAKAVLVEEAAALYVELGQKRKAAELLDQGGRRLQAAGLFVELGDFNRAISLYRAVGSVPGLIAAYTKRGDLAQAATECLEKGETGLAAKLFELNGDFEKAADLLAESDPARVCALYESAGNFGKAGDIYRKLGKLDMAVAAYEKAPDRAVDAADLYLRMIVLDESSRQQFDADVTHAAIARSTDRIVLATANRGLIYTTAELHPVWTLKLSGDSEPCAVAISDDGQRVAVSTSSSSTQEPNALLLIDSEKRVIWEKPHQEPVKAIVFAPSSHQLFVATGDQVIGYTEDGSILFSRDIDFKSWALDLNPTLGRLAVGTLGGSIYLFDLSGNPIAHGTVPERVHTLRFLGTGNMLAGVGERQLLVVTPEMKSLVDVSQQFSVRTFEPLSGRSAVAVCGAQQVWLVDDKCECLCSLSGEVPALTCLADPRSGVLHVSWADRTVASYSSRDCRHKAAEWYTRGNKLKEAATIFQEIEDYRTAYQLFTQIGDFEKAADTVELAGDLPTAARHYEVVGRFDKAAELYGELGETFKMANCYGKAGEHLKAAEIFEKMGDVIVAADHYERAGHSKEAGMLFHKAGQDERAVSNLESHLTSQPGDHTAGFELGSMYASSGRHDEAIKILQQLTDDPAFRRDALKTLGECFTNKQLYSVAIDRLTEALGEQRKCTKDNIDIFYDIGRSYEQAGRYDEAKDTYGKVLAIDYYYRDAGDRLKSSMQMAALPSKGAPTQVSAVDGTSATTAVPAEGERRYKILKKLGQGGMGVVYLALDQKLNRQVAWKVLPAQMASDNEARVRMLREAQAVAQFNHPNIISVYDISAEPNECYITMEYVEGCTLRDKIIKEKQIAYPDALRYAREIAQALEAAHRAGVVHRDIKPENIMLTMDDRVKVLDFGLAQLSDNVKVTRQGWVVGTVHYMSPEQVMGKEVDGLTDLYALGVVLFEMVAGSPPFVGENILAQHIQNEPPALTGYRTDVPEQLVAAVNKCLAKKKEDRFSSCDQLAKILAEIATPSITSTTMVPAPSAG